MGFDCTLHLVDEQLLRTQFVPRLIAEDDAAFAPTEFDRHQNDAARRWTRARRKLRGRNPEAAARAVCDLALLFSSYVLPFESTRGVALSLWHTLHPALAEDIPTDFIGSPEDVFSDLVVAFPTLKGAFLESFDGNGATGVYVPAAKAPALAAWVATAVKELDPGDRNALAPLLRVLEVAAAHGYAYWEGAEIEVDLNQMLTSDLLRPKARPVIAGVTEYRLAPAVSILAGADGSTIVVSDSESRRTAMFDLARWPPVEIASFEGYTLRAARAADGTWALLMQTLVTKAWEVYRLAPGKAAWFRRTMSAIAPEQVASRRLQRVRRANHDTSAARIGWVGSRIVTSPWEEFQRVWAVERDGALQPIADLPPLAASRGADGVARLGDGTDLLIYDGHAYEWSDDGVRKPWHLDVDISHTEWTAVPSGSDGFFFLSARRLYEVHRNGPPIRHLPDLENVMAITPGPPGWLLLQEGMNRRGDIGICYRPSDGACLSIHPDVIPQHHELHWFESLHWSEAIDSVLVRVKPLLWTIPLSVLRSRETLPLKPAADLRPVDVASDDPAWPHLTICYRDGVVSRLLSAWENVRGVHYRETGIWEPAAPLRSIHITFVISPDGSVTDLRLANSSGETRYDDLALQAAGSTRFRPLRDEAAPGVRLTAVISSLAR